jgi:hypothetical protein
MPLENRLASFDFAQDEAIFLMPSTISPHPERSEAQSKGAGCPCSGSIRWYLTGLNSAFKSIELLVVE